MCIWILHIQGLNYGPEFRIWSTIRVRKWLKMHDKKHIWSQCCSALLLTRWQKPSWIQPTSSEFTHWSQVPSDGTDLLEERTAEGSNATKTSGLKQETAGLQVWDQICWSETAIPETIIYIPLFLTGATPANRLRWTLPHKKLSTRACVCVRARTHICVSIKLCKAYVNLTLNPKHQ